MIALCMKWWVWEEKEGQRSGKGLEVTRKFDVRLLLINELGTELSANGNGGVVMGGSK